MVPFFRSEIPSPQILLYILTALINNTVVGKSGEILPHNIFVFSTPIGLHFMRFLKQILDIVRAQYKSASTRKIKKWLQNWKKS